MYSLFMRFTVIRRLRHSYLCTYRMMANYSRLPPNKVQLDVLQGRIIGTESLLPNDKPFYAFKGIPYAQPPIEQLRFAPPKPLIKFKDPVLDCTNERDVCFHRDMLTSEVIGSENCLFLNVYAPHDAKNLPVMIWLHGGAFAAGSGNSDYYSPEYLLEQNVIIVTINYRLAVLGFLCLPDAGIYGNAGLKDQRLAMQWVQQNIEKFGGDPDNVTIFGESAGGASVHIHALSAESRKYFHKAICQSGNAIMEWAFQPYAEEKSKTLAKRLGCADNDSQKILEFLRGIDDLWRIHKEYFAVMTPDERRRGLPLVFKPTIERDTEEAVITKSPLELMKSPIDTKNIPIMMGYTSKEGIVMLIDAVKNKKLDDIENDLARLIPRSVDLSTDDERCRHLANRIREFYFKGKKVSHDTMNELVDLNTDYHFTILAYLAAELHARYQNSSMYFFQFSIDKDFNLYKKFALMLMGLSDTETFKGASHTDDVYYLFKCRKFPLEPSEFPESEALLRRTCALWTNFAKYGDPTPDLGELGVRWKPVDKLHSDSDLFNLNYLQIENDGLINDVNPDGERYKFWKNVYEEFNNGLHKAKL